jgi:hypothetical protein
MPVFCNCCGNDLSGPGCEKTGIDNTVPVLVAMSEPEEVTEDDVSLVM